MRAHNEAGPMHVVGRLAVGAFVVVGIACSTISDGPIGSSSEKITSVAPNYQAVGNNDHYASVAEAYGGPLQNLGPPNILVEARERGTPERARGLSSTA
jgi:hypothetical protein